MNWKKESEINKLSKKENIGRETKRGVKESENKRERKQSEK